MTNFHSENGESKFSDEEIFRKYFTRLCHFAWQLLGRNEMTEDIVQDAFLSYWNHKSTVCQNPIAIKNFLYTTVRNSCYNVLRRDKVKTRYINTLEPDPHEEAIALDAIIRAEVINELYKVIQTLPESCAQVFRLGYLDGLTNPKIAEKLGISINTVKTQKQRGLKILKAHLNPGMFTLLMLIIAGE